MHTLDIAAILRETLFTAVKIGAPSLISALLAGLAISVFQTVTQISESTLAFLPKFFASMTALFIAGSFMYSSLLDYAHHIFDDLIVAGMS
ncbi:MAG: flagellar biosynthetic protein FliQ [Acetobacter sp.]|jgi:flagellar biosynthetic protein FliQ|nr:flagellar biosynthetic protein FliQ [Acetobacter sp.]MCH4060958.1 flagellar biosynthetic protein FliQ [Acetobacter sp.]MCH4087898.1 flagellar biosynthetic protein FliQ [Acetobacter sp.]MCI1293486.1 flagellar biosynthetic protein FliQ [Acetobacter sp.]MCI1319770.1 flagellar biosynthetic protein FliQ [Acetobacter sp.]